jgi:hypothetical protein
MENKMNERIRELMGKTLDDKFSYTWDTMTHEGLLQFSEKFAELIVAECNKISKETCNELKADESIQTPGSKINWNLYNATLRNKLAEHFWVEL